MEELTISYLLKKKQELVQLNTIVGDSFETSSSHPIFSDESPTPLSIFTLLFACV